MESRRPSSTSTGSTVIACSSTLFPLLGEPSHVFIRGDKYPDENRGVAYTDRRLGATPPNLREFSRQTIGRVTEYGCSGGHSLHKDVLQQSSFFWSVIDERTNSPINGRNSTIIGAVHVSSGHAELGTETHTQFVLVLDIPAKVAEHRSYVRPTPRPLQPSQLRHQLGGSVSRQSSPILPDFMRHTRSATVALTYQATEDNTLPPGIRLRSKAITVAEARGHGVR